ncbi:hypothetical protein HY489_02310 [Candidatus Woesearchaeota archaeon]|nr:hypothetical protein [Candidatus Woesearchaeota archaeon]
MRIVILTIVLAIIATSVTAYSGSFATTPPLPGGPNSNTVTNFDVDTRNGNNPQTLQTNLNYVYQIIIQTTTPITSNLLITENPSSGQSGDGSFSFTVPQRLQDELVQATIYFWGPDQATLTVDHVHQGQTTETLTAARAEPPQTDAQGRVLWVITTTSFSEFFPNGVPAPIRDNAPFYTYMAIVAIAALSATLLFKTE